MSTPTLERIDLSELGFADWEPVIPCEAHTLAVNAETPPKCDRPATGRIVIHDRCSTTLSCEPCYKLYLFLVGKLSSRARCATCRVVMDVAKAVWWEPIKNDS